jgi:NADPH-dependent 2,4-dienoyl-CoA reductase/sulfur reductase-like enzyme/peroxiredoxin family protein/rhodanese-related sulfurtransferase/TusA-related sulfurtransferase
MKIIIVGGVAAGMSAAARLRRLDESAEIIVFEKDEHVSFANCGLPYHIGGVIPHRENLLLHTPETLKAQLNLDVRIFSEVTAIDRQAKEVRVREVKTGRDYTEHYDKLVLAPGAKALRPPMPGINHPAILELRNVADMDRIIAKLQEQPASAVVMGGFIGIEAAENLAERGLAVTLVEKMPQIMGILDPEMARMVQDHLELHGVTVSTGAGVTGFRDQQGRVEVDLENGTTLKTDLVILAIGSVPNSSLARDAGLKLGPRGGIAVDAQMRTSDPEIFAGGDAIETLDFVTGQPTYIPMAGPANRQGRIIADNLCGRASAYTATQGTAIMKVFDLTVASTGASEKTLKRANIDYRRIYLHPNGHAGYYPGTAQMHLKLLFSVDGARILGAQIVGFDGVDKRIDILATAMRGHLGVRDLENLELAYAPPYGSAKDPINMAGFIAGNLLDGTVEFWYAEEFPEKTAETILLDVRGPAEFDAGHIPGAINLPLPKLRASVAGLDKSKAYNIYCKVGLRSYLALRVLKQNGFQAKTLAGGIDIFRAVHPGKVAGGSGGSCGCPPAAPKPPAGPKPPVAPPPATSCGGTPPPPPPATPPPTSRVVSLDCTGLQCPGPLQRLSETIKTLATGDELAVTASDPGFLRDAKAWCGVSGHTFLEGQAKPGSVFCRIRKNAPATNASTVPAAKSNKTTMVVFSGDLDKVMASLVIANGAVAMGKEVTLFFTFWGLNALRKDVPQAKGKTLLDAMFGWMMPRGIGKLKLSQMHMLGMGTAMMKHVMKIKNVDSPQSLLMQARKQGVKLVACTMSLDVMGLKPEELIDGIELGGVATFLAESESAGMTLFV